MKIVIELDDDLYEHTQKYEVGGFNQENDMKLFMAIRKGTPLPEHHGRLIDADALEYTCNANECGMLTGCNHCQYHIVTEHEIDNAPTIIEGSESE